MKINNNGTMTSDYSALIKVPTNRINPITIGNDGSLISDSVIINPNGEPNESITLNNKGVLVHNGLLSSNYGTVNQNSLGIEIVHDGNGIVSFIRNDGGNENIINGKIVGKDSFIIAEDNSVFNNKIINGAGVEKGTLQTNGALNINDSIVNSYKIALYLGGNSNVVITNSIFNDGGLDGSTSVIIGDNNNNPQLLGDSIVNGNINFGGGDDLLALDTTAIINGDINGGVGKDTLDFFGKNNLSVNIHNNISEFENININGDVVLFESINVTDADSINLESGNLTLRVDSTKKDSNGKIIGHALYGNTGMINSTGGKLSEDGKDINVTIKEFVDLVPSISVNPPVIIDKVLYNNLNNIYDSIVLAGEIGKLSNTTLLESKTKEKSLEALLSVLDQIYANTSYSYTLKSSRDSLKLFGDNISYLTIKPKYQEWLVQGRWIHTGVKSDNEASGKGYYGFDGGHRNYKTTTNTYGGLATFEYGLDDNLSTGFIFGGNNQDTKFKGSSSIDSSSVYLGAFTRYEINKFKLMTGLGYQYTEAKNDRGVSNQYNSFNTHGNYDINSYNIFAEGKYTYLLDEGYNQNNLSIKVNGENSETFDVDIGVDLVKETMTTYGKLNNIFSLGVINTLGDTERSLYGNVLGQSKIGNSFEIKGVELPDISGKIGYNLEL